jgi:RNA polymerase sigma-70 factor (ECF subfamily)
MRHPGDEALAMVHSSELSPLARAELRESLRQLLQLVQGLPPAQREVVQLKFEQGLSYREISEVTGHSVSYVGNLIHQAVRALRERLSRSADPARARSAR